MDVALHRPKMPAHDTQLLPNALLPKFQFRDIGLHRFQNLIDQLIRDMGHVGTSLALNRG